MNQLKRDRRAYVMQRIGCLACRRRGHFAVPGDQHHPNLDGHAGQRRLSNDIVMILCPWHHRGVPERGGSEFTRTRLGPSLAKQPNAFRAEFGSDEELLAEQERLIEQYERDLVGAA